MALTLSRLRIASRLPFIAARNVRVWPHRDRSHFGGRPSLSGHNGHGWSGGRPDPDANDPRRKSELAILLWRTRLDALDQRCVRLFFKGLCSDKDMRVLL